MSLFLRAVPALSLVAILTACGGSADPAEQSPDVAQTAAQVPGIDWRACRFADLALPVPGRLFVVDGGPPPGDAEPGRETIRRVDVQVPGPVTLMLTAPDASVWAVRASPQTELRAVFASGPQPQRITGQGIGATLAPSQAMGDDCGRYWLASGAGPELAEAAEQVFGRRYDALYLLQAGRVDIGSSETAPVATPVTP